VNLYLLCSGCGSPASYCQLAAAAGFIYCRSLGGALTPTYSSRLYLFRVLLGACPSPFLQSRVLPACYSCSAYLFSIQSGNCPLLCYTSATVASLKTCWGEPPNLPTLAGLFIYSLCRCLPLPISPELKAPCPLCYMSFSVPCLLFSFFFFCRAGINLSRGLCWFTPGVAVGVLCATHLLTCWSAPPKQAMSQCLSAQEPSWLLRVLWHAVAMCVLEFCLIGSFSCQVWLQHLSKIFILQSSCYLLPP
jgi:hypothetical protein